LEHIGLSSYGGREIDNEADKSAFMEMTRVLRPGGKLLLTVPFGTDMIHDGWIRSYTRLRLDSLLEQAEMAGYVVYEEEGSYFINTVQGWIHSTAEELQTTRQYEGMPDICGLYCGVFRKR
jgi:ubiquinone/menaquinone biosynthesis C-methylase UbiE